MTKEWKLFFDQNVRIEVKEELAHDGINALHTSDVGMQRAVDPEILDYAIRHERVLVTRDTDFGSLNIFPLPPLHPGVIRLRISPPLPSLILPKLKLFFETHSPEDVRNALVIISKDKVRFKRS
jgi:predicted nuclease of predicted toxin-antitoxin system